MLTPLSTSAPAFQNCCPENRADLRFSTFTRFSSRLRSGDAGVEVDAESFRDERDMDGGNMDSDGLSGVGGVTKNGALYARFGPVGESMLMLRLITGGGLYEGLAEGFAGDGSGVSRPFTHRPPPTRLSDAEPSSVESFEDWRRMPEAHAEGRGRLSCEPQAMALAVRGPHMLTETLDVLALGLCAGEEVGVRRGEGRGKSWSSSSSLIGAEIFSGSRQKFKEGLTRRAGEGRSWSSDSGSVSASCCWMSSSVTRGAWSSLLRSTAKNAVSIELRPPSKLALRRLRCALFVNFSVHSSPSFTQSSRVGMQLVQHDRNGTVATSGRGEVGSTGIDSSRGLFSLCSL